MFASLPVSLRVCVLFILASCLASAPSFAQEEEIGKKTAPRLAALDFSLRSVQSGKWSDPKTWEPSRVPRAGDRVRVSRGTVVEYDVESADVIRLVQVVGVLRFARDQNTELNVGILKIQNDDACSESGFACDFHGVSNLGEPNEKPGGEVSALEIGTLAEPLPAEFTAKIRLHYLDGLDKADAPAIVCCSARMDLHGAPLGRTWVDLGADVKPGDRAVELSEDVIGWRAGDEMIVTGSKQISGGNFREEADLLQTETRRIEKIEGRTLTLDQPLAHPHQGGGEYRSEVANLSRNVIVESADPGGVRGHTMYHRYSQGSISYARFAHLGKEGVLGRYAIHFHLIENSMRGSQVLGAAIVDSHNRWVTIHGTNHLVVRDCVGFRSVGHGFFLEDGTEVYNVLDRNLGVQAYRGRPLPDQVLSFDPNDGAAFWWANGRNSLTRNTSCENDEYGYRFDSQKRSNFDSNLSVMTPAGGFETVDIRTLPFYRFDGNEAHSEGLYGFAVAGTDGVGPDMRHPHVLKNLTAWQIHYGLRSELPTMWVENVKIDHAAYGVYRPWYDNHVYKNVYIGNTAAEPFNRGMDDEEVQYGKIAIDGLTFGGGLYGESMPYIQISTDNPRGEAESHFRNLSITRREGEKAPLVNLGGGPRNNPTTEKGVPVYVYDHYGPGRHAMIVSTRSPEYLREKEKFHAEPPLTGDESRVAEVTEIEFPKLLDPVDDLPPATVVTLPQRGLAAKLQDGRLLVRGTTTDNDSTRRVLVSIVAADAEGEPLPDAKAVQVEAADIDFNFHQWQATFENVRPGNYLIIAQAEDAAGNVEQTPHGFAVAVE